MSRSSCAVLYAHDPVSPIAVQLTRGIAAVLNPKRAQSELWREPEAVILRVLAPYGVVLS